MNMLIRTLTRLTVRGASLAGYVVAQVFIHTPDIHRWRRRHA